MTVSPEEPVKITVTKAVDVATEPPPKPPLVDTLVDTPDGGATLPLPKAGGGRRISRSSVRSLRGEGVDEGHIAQGLKEAELTNRNNKIRSSFALAVGEELDYLENQQQRLKVQIAINDSKNATDDDLEAEVSQKVAEPEVLIKRVNWRRDGPIALVVATFCLAALIIVCTWDPVKPRHDVHHVKMEKYQAHVTSPLYSVSSTQSIVIPMEQGKPTTVLDLKLVIPCKGYCQGDDAAHRRLAGGAGNGSGATLVGGEEVRWELLAGNRTLQNGVLVVTEGYEAESYEIMDPEELGAKADEVLTVRLTSPSKVSLGVLCEVMQLGTLGRHRVWLSTVLFLLCFGLILSEQINRCYATFIGAMSALFLVCLTYQTPSVASIMAMIDFGTLMLLCTMMMCVHILAVSGFFQWVAVRLAKMAKGNATVLFFIMANCMGLMSFILPNVTCVMLIGPITISLCKQMNLDPVPFYLAQTICSTVGGTATMIGDPPNLVIGNKLKLKFIDFIIFNGPVVLIILPLSSFLLYLRFKDKVGGKVEIDIAKMMRENRIIDERQFLFAAVVFFFITIGLFTSPFHGIRPCWFPVLGFFTMGLTISHHQIKSYLNAVEWDTLLFFANLFIFVECLAELGLITAVGKGLATVIKNVDIGSRLEVAVILVLWVSTIGSAFLESLPYTTTMTYILADLRNSGDMGIPVEPLCWALSVGCCVGGIGSIMGSSANLVSMAVSERYSPERHIKGVDFLKYGFPTLLCITVVEMLYQLLVFCVIRPYTL